MSVNEDALDDCERKSAAAGRLVVAAVAVNTAVMDLGKLLDQIAMSDSGFYVGEAATDAADSLVVARRALRDFRRIAEARETDLQDQIEELRASADDGDGDRA